MDNTLTHLQYCSILKLTCGTLHDRQGLPNTMTEPLRIVLITSGLRRVAHFFPELSGNPVGIINWSDSPSTHPSPFTQNELTRFVPTTALAHLSHGAINMHPSLLPDYRGAEPLLWQLAAAEPLLATTIHRLTDQFDCGGIVAQASIARPSGANRNTLADLTETRLGKQLLNKAIELLAENPTYNGEQQPEKSATPYAYRKSADEFGNQFSLTQFTPDTAWDLIQYFGQCPSPWLDNSTLQKKLTWIPKQLQLASETSIVDQQPLASANVRSNNWQTNQKSFTTCLICNGAQIVLKPRWRSFVQLLKS